MTLSFVYVPPQPASLASPLDPEQAFARVLPRIEAVADEQLVAINVDIPATVERLLACLPKLEGLRGDAALRLACFDAGRFSGLRELVLALSQAHILFLSRTVPVAEDLATLQEAAVALRNRLGDDAEYLVKRGVLDVRWLEKIKFLNGYRNVAYDLMALVRLFREDWKKLSSKSAVTEGDLSQAEAVARRVLQAVSTREQQAEEAARSALVRQRAYSLVFREYEAIRSAVFFLRWEQEDAESFAPSLFAGRRSPRRDRPQPTTGATAGSPAVGGAGASPVASPPVAPADKGSAEVPAGHLGGSPFNN